MCFHMFLTSASDLPSLPATVFQLKRDRWSNFSSRSLSFSSLVQVGGLEGEGGGDTDLDFRLLAGALGVARVDLFFGVAGIAVAWEDNLEGAGRESGTGAATWCRGFGRFLWMLRKSSISASSSERSCGEKTAVSINWFVSSVSSGWGRNPSGCCQTPVLGSTL